MHDHDSFAGEIEIAHDAEALDTEAVAVAHEPHAVGVAVAPDDAAGDGCEGVKDMSPADVTAVDDEVRASASKEVHGR